MKTSLNQQIDALRREIRDLENERPQRERKRGYNCREFDYHLECLNGAVNTILFVDENKDYIRSSFGSDFLRSATGDERGVF